MKQNLKIFILIIFDQVTKIIIMNHFMNETFRICKYVSFQVKLNKQQMSIFNNELNLGLSNSILILINILSIVCVYFLFMWIEKEEGYIRLFNMSYMFIQAGTISSLIDKCIFGGSLDYIRIGHNICDLKDFYLLISIMLVIVGMVNEIIRKHRLKL